MAEGDPAVVVVASFIGMEVAASLAGRGVRVTVVAPDSVPFERTLGPDVGGMYRELHESNGVTFLLGRAVESFRGDGGRVREAVLDTGDRVPARLAVLGVGVRPATEWLGVVPKADDGGLIVDELLRVEGRSDLFAAGDVASYPDPRDGGRLRIEHWRVAMQQGRTAACNMLGRETPYDAVPFFWTNQYMVITDYLGHAEEWDDALVDGDLEGGEFVVYYVGDGRARAVSCCGDEQAMLRIHHVLSRHPLPAAEELRDA